MNIFIYLNRSYIPRKPDRLSKRALLEESNKNEALWNIAFAFITVPLVFTAFGVAGGGILAAIIWSMVFAGPIMHKLMFGTWFGGSKKASKEEPKEESKRETKSKVIEGSNDSLKI
jgi:hypothetical protein